MIWPGWLVVEFVEEAKIEARLACKVSRMLPQDRSELPARYPRTRYPRPWKLLAGVSIQPVCQTASLCNAHAHIQTREWRVGENPRTRARAVVGSRPARMQRWRHAAFFLIAERRGYQAKVGVTASAATKERRPRSMSQTSAVGSVVTCGTPVRPRA